LYKNIKYSHNKDNMIKKEVIAMTHQDYVKFLTEQLVLRMDRTKQDKQKNKDEKTTDILSNTWFGIFPISWKILTKK